MAIDLYRHEVRVSTNPLVHTAALRRASLVRLLAIDISLEIKMYIPRLLNLLIVVTLLVITACAPQVELTPTAESTVAPTATATIAPTATTAPTVIPSVTPTAVPTEVGSFPIGKFFAQNAPNSYFTFSKDGRWAHLDVDVQFALATGRFSVDGDTYIQTSNSSGCAVPMSFKYTFDGTYLKFQLTDESRNDSSCPDRNGFYDNTTYIFTP